MSLTPEYLGFDLGRAWARIYLFVIDKCLPLEVYIPSPPFHNTELLPPPPVTVNEILDSFPTVNLEFLNFGGTTSWICAQSEMLSMPWVATSCGLLILCHQLLARILIRSRVI